MRPSRAGAALLAALGLLAVTPLAILDLLWIGPQMFGAGLGADGLFAAIGLVMFAGALLPLACLALAVPAWRDSRRAQRLGVGLALFIALLALGPTQSLSPLSWIWGGRWLLVVVAAAAALTLALAARSEHGDGQVGLGRAPRALTAGLALVFVAGALLGRVGDSIPFAPSGLLAGELREGSQPAAQPLAAAPTARARGLLAGQGSTIHNDGAMSDVYYGRRAIDPAEAEVRSFRALGDCASILFDDDGRLVAVCVGGTRIVAYVLDPETLEPLAERRLGDRTLGLDFATNFAGGGYAVLDHRGRLVVPGSDGSIDRFLVDGDTIEPIDGFDVAATLAPDESITSALPDDTRRLWYVGSAGTVGVVDPRGGEPRSIRFEGTEVENSFALAPGGGAFVVTSEQLVRLRIGADGGPRIVWARDYDNGERLKPGQTSRASGTTPTVMLGGRFVAITDNAEPRMNVQVYAARSGELACEVPVFASGESATENSLIAAGRSLFVENNYGYKLLEVTAGHTGEPGVARIDFDPATRTCAPIWENDDVHIPSVVSKVSADDGQMLTYTKPAKPTGIDAWYFTAIDAGTGEVLWERLAGAGPLANNHYAALYLGPTGNLYVGAVGGVIGLVLSSR